MSGFFVSQCQKILVFADFYVENANIGWSLGTILEKMFRVRPICPSTKNLEPPLIMCIYASQNAYSCLFFIVNAE